MCQVVQIPGEAESGRVVVVVEKWVDCKQTTCPLSANYEPPQQEEDGK